MLCYFLFLVLSHQATAVYIHRPDAGEKYGPPVVSRDVSNTEFGSEISAIEARITEIIKSAESDKGIAFRVLKSEARAIKELAQYVLSQLKANVSDKEVKKILNEATSLTKFGATLSPVIIDPLSIEARSLNFTLLVLQQLGKRLDSQKGENYEATLAAIIENCNFITGILEIAEDFAVFLIQNQNKQRSLLKRQWTSNLNAGYTQANGFGATAGLQYSKGNFEFGAGGGWNQNQGLNYGLSASWKFGRK